VAEYAALVRGLALAAQFNPQRLEIFADSELVVRQITGQYRVKSPDLLPLFEQAQIALLKFDSWQIRHIRREQNARADRLANLAMNRKGDVDDAEMESLPEQSRGERESAESAGPAVDVQVVLGCDPRKCPATMMPGEAFRFDFATPRGFCVFAAAAVVPRVVEMLSDSAAQPEQATVACPRCGAKFQLRRDD